jgi:uncharacterized protein (UPF0332 family)
MITPQRHIDKARRTLASGSLLLSGHFTEQAGRDAYIAAFHAAQAFTVSRTGKEPKTHTGARSEFARLVRDEPAIPQRFVTFLANAYELKTHADYDGEEPVPEADAAAALKLAAEMVEAVAALLGIA